MVAPMDMANARAPPDMGRRHRAANPEWEEITVSGAGRRHVRLGTIPNCPELLEAPKARPRRQSEAPIRYLPVPQSAHTARSAGRPFFMVTRSTSRDGVLARHFRQ